MPWTTRRNRARFAGIERERALWREKARLRAEELALLRVENERLREQLSEAHLARIEAQNPGIDVERVREQWGDALSSDADPPGHLRIPYEGDTTRAGELMVATEHPPGTCAACDQREDADVEPMMRRRTPERGGEEPDADPVRAEHDYLSTACLHGLHDRCRLRCKFCYAECRCPCGHQDLLMDDQAVMDRHGQWWQPIDEPPWVRSDR